MKIVRRKSIHKIWINLIALWRIASEVVAKNDVETFDYLARNIMSIAVELGMPNPSDWQRYEIKE